jgi:hypothetical protein
MFYPNSRILLISLFLLSIISTSCECKEDHKFNTEKINDLAKKLAKNYTRNISFKPEEKIEFENRLQNVIVYIVLSLKKKTSTQIVVTPKQKKTLADSESMLERQIYKVKNYIKELEDNIRQQQALGEINESYGGVIPSNIGVPMDLERSKQFLTDYLIILEEANNL